MQTATKKTKQLLKKVKRFQFYLFLRCKLAFAFIKDSDISSWYIPKYRRISTQTPDSR